LVGIYEWICLWNKYIKEKENQVVSALKKRAHEVHISVNSMFSTYLKDKILEARNWDQQYVKIKESLQQGNAQQKFNYYELKEDVIVMYKDKVYVPNSNKLKNTAMREMHNVPYVEHPRYHKTITTIKSQYCWPWMKKEVVVYIARCLGCQKVKIEHRHPTRLL